jgi:serine/threonine protein kinase
MAPESIAKREYSKKSDVWSFGIVCMFLFLFEKTENENEFYVVSIDSIFLFLCFFSVYEIVARCEPHHDMDILQVAIAIR